MTGALTTGGVAFALVLALAPLCKSIARRSGAVNRPRTDRWHQQPIPLLGGVAIAGAVGLALAVVRVGDQRLLTLLAGAFAMAVVGLIDDLRPIRPQIKFVLQILTASAMAALGLQLHLSPYPSLDVLLTLLWIVGITNAFNLLDNMDGLAAGIAAIAAAFRLAFFLNDGDLEAAQVAAAVVGASLGFLIHNFNPASIFMGDAGSLFLGVLVSGLGLVGTFAYSRSTVSVLLFPVLLLLVPIFDTTLVTLARTWAGRPISQGGRDHASHRLVASGLSERGAVLLLYGVAVLCGVVAFQAYAGALSTSIVLASFLAIGLTLFGVYLSRVEVYPTSGLSEVAPQGAFVRLLDSFPYRRQVATVFLDTCLIILAYYCAYRLRYEQRYDLAAPYFVTSLPIVLAVQLTAFAAFRVYQGVWRYTSLPDAIRLTKAVSAGAAASALALLLFYRFEGYSRAVFVTDWALLLLFTGGARISLRLLDELFRQTPDDVRRVLIYGAGDGGVLTLREITNNRSLQRVVVGFIDDDRWKRSAQIHGVPVVGDISAVATLIEKEAIDEVIVASTKIPVHHLRSLAEQCEARDVAVVRASLVMSGSLAPPQGLEQPDPLMTVLRWGPFAVVMAAVLAFQGYTWFLKRAGETAYLPTESALVAPAYVGGESVVRQGFEMWADGLQAVRLFARPQGASPIGTAQLELIDLSTGVSVARTTMPAAALTASVPFEWAIPRIDQSAGRAFQLVLSAPDAAPDQGLLLEVGAPLYAGGTLTIGGREVWGDLKFSTRAARARAIDALRKLRRQAPPWARSELLFVAIGLLVNLALARVLYDVIVDLPRTSG